MRTDMFGADAPVTDGSTAVTPPSQTATSPASAAVVAAASGAVPPAPGTPPPTIQQAVDKAQAKVAADVAVASNPAAVHHVKLMGLTGPMAGSAATGAGIGFVVAGPPGAAVGAVAGWAMEKYQIAGGPLGKLAAKIKSVVSGAAKKV